LIERTHKVLAEMLFMVRRQQTGTDRWEELLFELRWLNMVLNRMEYEMSKVFEIQLVQGRGQPVTDSVIGSAMEEVEGLLAEEFPGLVPIEPSWQARWRLRRTRPRGFEARVTRERQRWTPSGRGQPWD